jgi:hypothetical protein
MYSSKSGNILTTEVTQAFVVQRLRIKTNKYVNTLSVQAAPYCPHKNCCLKKVIQSDWQLMGFRDNDRPVAIVVVWTSRRQSDKTDTSVHNSGHLKNTPQLCRTSLISRLTLPACCHELTFRVQNLSVWSPTGQVHTHTSLPVTDTQARQRP